MDIGLHTGITKPNSSVPVVYSMINYFLNDQKGKH
jgi:hypothetical protein